MDSERLRFQEQGFLGPLPAFHPRDMEFPCEIIAQRVLNAPSELSPYATQSRHLDSRTVWSLCSAPAIVEKLQKLFGPDLMIWASFIFDKGGQRVELDGEIAWHQDCWFWGYESIENLSVWLALTPATPENGCVELLPGSHRELLDHVHTARAEQASWFGGYEAPGSKFDIRQKVNMVMDPGQFFIFTERTLHHSKPNHTGQRRLGLSIRVARPSLRSNRPEPCVMLSGVDRFGVNRFVDPPIGEPDLEPSLERLQISDAVRVEGPWLGLGWHAPEPDGDRWLRWSGPDRVSWVDLRWSGRGAGMFQCTISHSAAPDLLSLLKARVNGEPLGLTWRQTETGTALSAPVSEAALQSARGRARVELELPWVVTPSMAGFESCEARTLGVAVSDLSITEIAGR